MKYGYAVLLAFFMCVIVAKDLRSQKKVRLSSMEEVVQHAAAVLDEEAMNGDLNEYGKKYGVRGNYTYDITLDSKGKVVTVFSINRDGSIEGQNRIKDFLKDYRFSFKAPKGKRYKFQYQVTLK